MFRNERSSRVGFLGAAAALLIASMVVATDIPKSAVGSTTALVGLYVPMQEALAGDSTTKVREQATQIVAEASRLAEAGGDKAALNPVIAAARGVTASGIDELREQFKPLSIAVAKLVEKEAVAGHGIYFCPMADGYWVQKRGDVANPYYGKEMLRCGGPVAKVAS